jgi:hypothetical protein
MTVLFSFSFNDNLIAISGPERKITILDNFRFRESDLSIKEANESEITTVAFTKNDK